MAPRSESSETHGVRGRFLRGDSYRRPMGSADPIRPGSSGVSARRSRFWDRHRPDNRKALPADTQSGAHAVVRLMSRARPKVDAQANSQSLRAQQRSSPWRHTHVIRHHAARSTGSPAATALGGIGSSFSAQNAAAAVPTTGVVPAAADEVSALTAAQFAAHAQLYQAVAAQAAAIHEQFVNTLGTSAGSYAATEAANAAAAG